MLARERARDLRLDEVGVERQGVDAQETEPRVAGDRRGDVELGERPPLGVREVHAQHDLVAEGTLLVGARRAHALRHLSGLAAHRFGLLGGQDALALQNVREGLGADAHRSVRADRVSLPEPRGRCRRCRRWSTLPSPCHPAPPCRRVSVALRGFLLFCHPRPHPSVARRSAARSTGASLSSLLKIFSFDRHLPPAPTDRARRRRPDADRADACKRSSLAARTAAGGRARRRSPPGSTRPPSSFVTSRAATPGGHACSRGSRRALDRRVDPVSRRLLSHGLGGRFCVRAGRPADRGQSAAPRHRTPRSLVSAAEARPGGPCATAPGLADRRGRGRARGWSASTSPTTR